ncbi:putative permease of the major facilitator superfamily [Neofusicoccum parvum]|uniref:Permease of the major facilitator superfamily n=1 Tax=Neofusicoccum parvum TaxID=310453 RepID=A0ACB5SGH5_9PEZI|nr:putative permease of the major facilitator superfamily [Neofusicoccum parvum]
MGDIDIEKEVKASEATKIEDVETSKQRIEVTASQQAYIRRKFDRRVLPIVCILYVLSYLDRGNIGNAKASGADVDLGLNSAQWSWVLNAFYICYVLMEWTTVLWKILPAHIFIATLCALWGVAAMCSGATHNMAGLIVCRCLLGIFEAAFGAGAPYFLSLFYQRRELGLRVSLLLGMSPLANTFASSLAYGITHIKNSIEPWRLLLLIEGAPTVLFAPVVFFCLPDHPSMAKFLTEDEKTQAVERMQTVDHTAKSKLKWSQVTAGLTDYKPYVHTLMHFCCNYSFAGLSNFLPTIVRDMGYSSVNAQGLTAPAYFVAFLLCVAAAYMSDRYGKRGFIVAGFAAVGAAGYLVLVVVRDEQRTGPRYAGIWLAACGVFPALSINITWLLNNQGGDSKRGAGLAVLAVFGQCSSFLSSSVFPEEDGPFYTKGCAIGCAFTGLVVVLALGLHWALERENARRDRLYGEVADDVRVDVTNGGDSRDFRYLT